MTVIFTVLGVVVFTITFLTKDFKTAFKRFWLFALSGLAIDMFIVLVAVGVMHVAI